MIVPTALSLKYAIVSHIVSAMRTLQLTYKIASYNAGDARNEWMCIGKNNIFISLLIGLLCIYYIILYAFLLWVCEHADVSISWILSKKKKKLFVFKHLTF